MVNIGGSIGQGALIIPKPSSANCYYLFHEGCDYSNPFIYPKALYLTEIDMNMNLNNGLGAVTIKNQILITDSMNVGKITACKHGNGRDWWIFLHRVNSNMFFKFLLTPDSLIGPTTQNIGSIRPDDAGQAKFSSDGKRFAYFVAISGLDLFDFDRCTGLFSNPLLINLSTPNAGCGIAFSSSSKYLYATSFDTTSVFQFNVDTSNIVASQQLVAIN